jgi:hypothetical protein
MRTVVSVRVELDLELAFEGSLEFGPDLDNRALARVVGATLEGGSETLAEVGLLDVTVLGQREEETWEDRDRRADLRDWVRRTGAWPDEEVLDGGGYHGENCE